jgi:hypothetical protein
MSGVRQRIPELSCGAALHCNQTKHCFPMCLKEKLVSLISHQHAAFVLQELSPSPRPLPCTNPTCGNALTLRKCPLQRVYPTRRCFRRTGTELNTLFLSASVVRQTTLVHPTRRSPHAPHMTTIRCELAMLSNTFAFSLAGSSEISNQSMDTSFGDKGIQTVIDTLIKCRMGE